MTTRPTRSSTAIQAAPWPAAPCPGGAWTGKAVERRGFSGPACRADGGVTTLGELLQQIAAEGRQILRLAARGQAAAPTLFPICYPPAKVAKETPRATAIRGRPDASFRMTLPGVVACTVVAAALILLVVGARASVASPDCSTRMCESPPREASARVSRRDDRAAPESPHSRRYSIVRATIDAGIFLGRSSRARGQRRPPALRFASAPPATRSSRLQTFIARASLLRVTADGENQVPIRSGSIPITIVLGASEPKASANARWPASRELRELPCANGMAVRRPRSGGREASCYSAATETRSTSPGTARRRAVKRERQTTSTNPRSHAATNAAAASTATAAPAYNSGQRRRVDQQQVHGPLSLIRNTIRAPHRLDKDCSTITGYHSNNDYCDDRSGTHDLLGLLALTALALLPIPVRANPNPTTGPGTSCAPRAWPPGCAPRRCACASGPPFLPPRYAFAALRPGGRLPRRPRKPNRRRHVALALMQQRR